MAELLLNIFTTANLLILSLLVVFKKDRSPCDRILSLISFVQFLYFLDDVFLLTGWIRHFPHLLFLSYFVNHLNAPLIFFYVGFLLGRRIERFHPLYVLSGFAILVTLFSWFGFLQMGSSGRLYFLGRLTQRDYPWQMNVQNYMFVATQFCYLLLSIMRVHRYFKETKEVHPIGDVQLRSSQNNNILIFIINATMVPFYAFLPTPDVVYVVIPLAVTIMYLSFTYSVFRHSVVFSSVKTDDLHRLQYAKDGREPTVKHAAIQLKPELIENYTSRIIQCIADDKPYIDPGLTLDKLAHRLKIPKHHLSFVINHELKKSFFDLVNYYRVEEAKKKLLDKEMKSLSVDAVGYDVGFNTKSAFYRSFKKLTGQTPALFSRSLHSTVREI